MVPSRRVTCRVIEAWPAERVRVCSQLRVYPFRSVKLPEALQCAVPFARSQAYDPDPLPPLDVVTVQP